MQVSAGPFAQTCPCSGTGARTRGACLAGGALLVLVGIDQGLRAVGSYAVSTKATIVGVGLRVNAVVTTQAVPCNGAAAGAASASLAVGALEISALNDRSPAGMFSYSFAT